RDQLGEEPGLVAWVGVGPNGGGPAVGVPIADGVGQGGEPDGDAKAGEYPDEAEKVAGVVAAFVVGECCRHPGGVPLIRGRCRGGTDDGGAGAGTASFRMLESAISYGVRTSVRSRGLVRYAIQRPPAASLPPLLPGRSSSGKGAAVVGHR